MSTSKLMSELIKASLVLMLGSTIVFLTFTQNSITPPSEELTSKIDGVLQPIMAPGFQALEMSCIGKCHSVQRIIQQRRTAEEWKRIIRKMGNFGARQESAILQYLIRNYTF